MAVPIFKLVNNFKMLFDDGYCEEDILDAFIASMERMKIEESDTERIENLNLRIENLEEVSKKWSEYNEENMGDF